MPDEAPLPALLRRVVARYVRAFTPERIVLFGSRAKHTSRPESDVDLLVVADVIADAYHVRRARQLAMDCFPPVDVVFATPEEVDGAATAESPFLSSILRTGVTLYRRA